MNVKIKPVADALQQLGAEKVVKVFNELTGLNLGSAHAWVFVTAMQLVREVQDNDTDRILLAHGVVSVDELITKVNFRASVAEGVAKAADPAYDLQRHIEMLQECPSCGHCSYSKDGDRLDCEDCGTRYDWKEPPKALMELEGDLLMQFVVENIGIIRRVDETEHELRKRALSHWSRTS